MNPLVQNVLWCIAGIVGVVCVIKLLNRNGQQERPGDTQNTKLQPDSCKIHSTPPVPLVPDGKNEITKLSAKEAFLCNVEKFKSILPQLNNRLNIAAWSEQIVDINNPQLIELWKSCLTNVAIWKQMLSSWGLRQDTCKTFTYLNKYANIYDMADGSAPEDGCKYRVIDGCWILTNDNNGEKRVIRKGLIEKI